MDTYFHRDFMKRIATALLLTATVFGAQAATPDYKLVFDVEGDRTQLVFVRSAVEEYGKHRIREIWSPGYNAPGKQFSAAVANRLLEDAQDAKLGGWVKQEQLAMFVVKVDANASADALSEAIEAAMNTADAMELELTGTDEY